MCFRSTAESRVWFRENCVISEGLLLGRSATVTESTSVQTHRGVPTQPSVAGRAPSALTSRCATTVNAEETSSLRSQIETLKTGVAQYREFSRTCSESRSLRSQIAPLKTGRSRHSRRSNAYPASFEAQSLGHNVALRVSAGLSCKHSITLQ